MSISINDTYGLQRATLQRQTAPNRIGIYDATSVPSTQTMTDPLLPIHNPSSSGKENKRNQYFIHSPRLSPSVVSAEEALKARAAFAPVFQNHVLLTRIERISNTLAEAPRFNAQLDILA